MMQINQRKVGSIITYMQMLLGVVISLIYTPYMIQRLGQSEYGLYNTVASTISMLSILSLGFNSSYIRYFAKYKNNDDTQSIKRLNGLFLIVFVIIGMIALFCGIYLAFNLDIVFRNGLNESEYQLAKVLMLLLAINLAISFPMSVFANIITAHERFVFLKLLGIFKTVLGPLVTIPLLLAGYRSVAIVTVTLAFSIVTDVSYLIYVIFKLKCRFSFSHFEKGLFKDISIYASFIAMNIIIDQINWNMGRVLLARYRGTVAVALYSVGFTLNSYYSMSSIAVSGVFTPMVHKIINESKDMLETQRQLLTNLVTRVGRIQFLILGLISTGLIFFGKQFIFFWAGEGYEESYYVVLLLAIPATIPLIQNVGIEIQRALNIHKFRSIVYLLMALLNLGLSIYLCQILGAVGSAIGTAISLIIANGFIMNFYYHKRCNIDIIFFWKNILKMCGGMLLPALCGVLLMHFVHFTSLLMLCGGIVVYAIIYCVSVWIFSMNEYEKNIIVQPIKRLLNRRTNTNVKSDIHN